MVTMSSRHQIRRSRNAVTDDDIRQILIDGVVWVDDEGPLDMDEIEEEERRFWKDEDWDSAEEL